MTARLDPKRVALLLLDFQVGVMSLLPENNPVLDNAASAITIARKHGVQVAYIRISLDEADAQAVPETNFAFARFKQNKEMLAKVLPDSPATQFHPKVAPKTGDLVNRKVRAGAFMVNPSKTMLDDFTAKGIDVVFLAGVSTSGAVLSSLRQLWDLDYGLFVLEDCCADLDEEVHRVLCEKVFPRSAKVIKSSELDGLF